MKRRSKAFCGALLLLGVAGIVPQAALAQDGSHFDAACNCRRPDSEYNTRRYERLPPRVVTYHRVIDRTRVVRGSTKLIQENRLIVHVRPVIHREVIIHRTNTVVKDLILHRVRTTNALHEVYRHEVVDRYVEGTVRHVVERRELRGTNCHCGQGGEEISSRD